MIEEEADSHIEKRNFRSSFLEWKNGDESRDYSLRDSAVRGIPGGVHRYILALERLRDILSALRVDRVLNL